MRMQSTFSACALVLLASATTASAQNSSGANSLELEEVVVTATKRDTDLQKTSIAVQVYQGEALKREGKKRIDEIMSGTAGVQVQDGPQGASFYMRGINGTPFFNDTGGTSPGLSTVAVMVDGVVQARNESVRGGTLDMAQAEIMRGPQSTTVGANALVGAVSLVSNQPVFEYQANASLEVGNYNLLATSGVLNVPLADNHAMRLAFSTNKRDGYVSSGAGDSDLLNARLKYRWQASEDLDAVLTAEYQKIGGNGVTQGTITYQGSWEPYNPANAARYDQVSGFPLAYGHLNPANDPTTYLQRSNPWNDGFPANGWGNGPFYNSKITTVSLNVDWDLGFGTLTALPSYQKIHYTTNEPNVSANDAFVRFDQTQIFKQLDLRLASNGSGKLEWLTGLYFGDNSRSGPVVGVFAPGAGGMGGAFGSGASCPVAGSVANPAGLNCYQWTNTADSSAKETSIYGNLTYSLLDPLRLVGAVRYTKDVKEFLASKQTAPLSGVGASGGPSVPYVYSNYTTPAAGYNANSGGRGKGTWSKTTYRAGIEYDVLPDVMAYATYSTGFQAGDVATAMGGANIGRFPYVCDSSENANCSLPLLLKQFTLGLKSRWFDDKLQANIEAFDTRYTNQQQNVVAFVANAAPYAVTTPAGACTIAATGNPAGTNGTNLCITDGSATLQVQSQGVDLDLSYLPTANDRIDLTAEWLKSSYSAASVNPATQAQLEAFGIPTLAATNLLTRITQVAAGFDGLPQQNSPSRSFNTSYSHSFHMGTAGTLIPKINWVYKSEYWTAGFPTGTRSATNTQKTYNLYNAYLSWEAADGKFTVNGYVRNIDNKPVLLNQSGRPGTANAIGLDQPRTYGVVLSANF